MVITLRDKGGLIMYLVASFTENGWLVNMNGCTAGNTGTLFYRAGTIYFYVRKS